MIQILNLILFKMKNSILKGALKSFNEKKETSKDFEVITSLQSIKGGKNEDDIVLGCSQCKKKQN